MVKIYVQTPLKFWFHIKFSREYDYVNEYPYSAKLQNMTCWTESGTQSSHIKGLDKCVWCWVCSVLSKQRGEVVWWGGGVRFTKANCGQESQWPYTDCGPAVTGMFASCPRWTYFFNPVYSNQMDQDGHIRYVRQSEQYQKSLYPQCLLFHSYIGEISALNIKSNHAHFHSRKYIRKCRLQSSHHVVWARSVFVYV